MSINEAFKKLGDVFKKGVFEKETTYYFHIGETQKTVTVSSESFKVEDGKKTENADCFCKMPDEFFNRIWDEGYVPQLKDFMTGEIKSNNPILLKSFFEAFHSK
jgi:putative sterol carrier protein